MTRTTFSNSSDKLMAVSAVLSLVAFGSHCLVLTGFFGMGGYFTMACVLWALSVGAVMCAARALWVLFRRTKEGLPRPLLGPVVGVFLMGLGVLLTLADSFILYFGSQPER